MRLLDYRCWTLQLFRITCWCVSYNYWPKKCSKQPVFHILVLLFFFSSQEFKNSKAKMKTKKKNGITVTIGKLVQSVHDRRRKPKPNGQAPFSLRHVVSIELVQTIILLSPLISCLHLQFKQKHVAIAKWKEKCVTTIDFIHIRIIFIWFIGSSPIALDKFMLNYICYGRPNPDIMSAGLFLSST